MDTPTPAKVSVTKTTKLANRASWPAKAAILNQASPRDRAAARRPTIETNVAKVGLPGRAVKSATVPPTP